eukprot:2940256-Pleurochrysis_carterae.AAC.2
MHRAVGLEPPGPYERKSVVPTEAEPSRIDAPTSGVRLCDTFGRSSARGRAVLSPKSALPRGASLEDLCSNDTTVLHSISHKHARFPNGFAFCHTNTRYGGGGQRAAASLSQWAR